MPSTALFLPPRASTDGATQQREVVAAVLGDLSVVAAAIAGSIGRCSGIGDLSAVAAVASSIKAYPNFDWSRCRVEGLERPRVPSYAIEVSLWPPLQSTHFLICAISINHVQSPSENLRQAVC